MTHRLSLREYAAHRRDRGLSGTSHTAVLRAIRAGRLDRGAVREDGQWRIDPDIADEEWEGTTRPQMQRDDPKGGRPPKPDPVGQTKLFAELEEPPPPLDGGAAITPIRAAAERDQYFRALQRELDYRKSAGDLLDAAAVRRTWYACSEELARHLKNMADSLTPILALETDERVVRDKLDRELALALEKFLGDAPAASRRSG